MFVRISVSGMDGGDEDAVIPILDAAAVVDGAVSRGIGVGPTRSERIRFRVARSGPGGALDRAYRYGHARSGGGRPVRSFVGMVVEGELARIRDGELIGGRIGAYVSGRDRRAPGSDGERHFRRGLREREGRDGRGIRSAGGGIESSAAAFEASEILIGGDYGRRIHVAVSRERPAAPVGRHVAVGSERSGAADAVGIDGIRAVGRGRNGVFNGKASRVGDFGGRAGCGRSAVRSRAGPIERAVASVGIDRRGVAGRTEARSRIRGSRRTARGSAASVDRGKVGHVGRTRSVRERSGSARRRGVFNEARHGTGRRGIVSGNYRRARHGRDARDLKKRHRPGFSVLHPRAVDGSDGKVFGFVCGERRAERGFGYLELLGIEFQFGVIRVSGGVVGVGRVPVASGKRRRVSVEIDDRSRKGRGCVVDDVVPGGTVGYRGFARNGRLYGTDVRLEGGVLGILRISRERQKPDRRENGQHRYDDDEFRECEGGAPNFAGYRIANAAYQGNYGHGS